MRRSWRFMSALALVASAASIFLSSWLFVKVQDERKYATVQACLRESGRSKAILTYLESLGADEKDLSRARPYFPVLTEDQCAERADQTVGPPPPQ